MSGGRINFMCDFRDCADQIADIIRDNTVPETTYPPAIIEKFRETEHCLRRVAEMVRRVDYLLSGDDGEESFLRRWKTEVRAPMTAPLKPNESPDGLAGQSLGAAPWPATLPVGWLPRAIQELAFEKTKKRKPSTTAP